MTICGTVDEIRFRNEDNGYTIIVLDYEGDPLVCVGTFPPLCEGGSLTLVGQFVNHSRFGRQFKVDKIQHSAPDTLDGIVRYLGGGLIKGIGPKTALTIVETFGENTLKVIELTPQLLTKIPRISKAKAEEISSQYAAVKQMRDDIMFLTEHNISLNMALKIRKVYGENTAAAVKVNPYRLIEDVDGIGFITADRIARSLGITEESDFRLRAAIIYTLKDSADKNGNTYLPKDSLLAETEQLLNYSMYSQLERNLDALVLERKVKLLDFDDGIMLSSLYITEMGVATKLVRLVNEANAIQYDVDSDIKNFQAINGITFHEAQREAISLAVNSGATIITGGPGTGKTTLIKCVLSVFENLGKKTALMAPTGRAAKRLSESTDRDATTIHRALFMDMSNSSSGEKIAADVIIVDEFSMVDIFLFNTLLDKLLSGTKIIMVGDKDQLPSVGAGNVLKDVLNCGIVPVASLSQIYRQADESLIITNAHAVNRGEMPDLKCKSGDFFFYKALTAENIASSIVGLVSERLPKYLNLEPYKIQVLCPMKNGAAGANNINRLLQDAINPDKGQPKIQWEDSLFRVGDKVMHIANNYSLAWVKRVGLNNIEGEGVFNGDLGIITDIHKSGEIEVLFEDSRQAIYTADLRSQLILAYAITVHKSQGSEFDAIIAPIIAGSGNILTRNLLYTALTRAKRMAVLVGEEYNIKRMVDNNYIAARYSALTPFITQAVKNIGLLYGDF